MTDHSKQVFSFVFLIDCHLEIVLLPNMGKKKSQQSKQLLEPIGSFSAKHCLEASITPVLKAKHVPELHC